MSDLIIKVENLSKRYRIGVKDETHDNLTGKIISWIISPFTNFRRVQKLSKFNNDDAQDIIWAMKNISFEVNNGEILGIIGKNGAGKSTLLKILSRIVEPTSGQATVYGRVASLLEIGTGFHRELSGRENIYLNGTILGMTKGEINKNFDDIVEFSEVGKFIDTPVKRYSSGMYVRLAFAVAAHLNPEVLIIDEVLAVGDAAFQKKCLGKMSETAKSGRTVLFVSHNMHTIQHLCSRTILLEDGKIVLDGKTNEVVGHYLRQDTDTLIEGENNLKKWHGTRKSFGNLRLTAVRTLDNNGEICTIFNIYDPITIEVDIKNITDNGFVLSYMIHDPQANMVYHIRSQDSNIVTQHLNSKTTVRMTIPELRLVENTYSIDIWLGNYFDLLEDHVENVMTFNIINQGHSVAHLKSIIHETGRWEIV